MRKPKSNAGSLDCERMRLKEAVLQFRPDFAQGYAGRNRSERRLALGAEEGHKACRKVD